MEEETLMQFTKALADAIRDRDGTTDPINPQDFAARILALSNGESIDGEVRIFFDETKPASKWGGSWDETAFPYGTFLMAAGSGGEAGKKGGSNLHTLTINELPQHRHDVHIVGNQSTSYEGITMQTSWSKGEVINDFVQYTGGGAPFSIIPTNVSVHIWREIS